jgi:D-proline reductase (dithiol) PrdB
VPFTPLSKKIEESRVGLLSTSGAYSLGQSAYHYKDDSSLRSIDKNCSIEDIRFSHITENYLENPRKDPNCILPLGQLLRMEKEGKIGELADQVFSCMGGIYSQRKVLEDIAPDVYSRFLSQEVDVALLVPM